MEALIIISVIIISGCLNRLRGTGTIKHFGTLNILNKQIQIKLVWNHIYALFIGLVVGLLSMNVYAGLIALIAYMVGESKGWGEWVGALTRWETKDEKWLQQQYKDNEGVGFPYMHQIANYFIKEQVIGGFETGLKQYFKYATLALVLRGIYWWLPVYLTMAYFGLITYIEALIIGLFLGLTFPLACKLGKLWNFNKKIGILNFSRGWENQEIFYGLLQGLVLCYVIVQNI